MRRYSLLDTVAFLLMAVGALNWGLVGVFDVNLVTLLFGVDTAATNFVYALVGLAALYFLFTLPSTLKAGDRRYTQAA